MAAKLPENRVGVKLDESGGESITITVTVNNKLHYYRTATITGNPSQSQVRRYKTDDGKEINHNRETGYIELAKKMLNL